MSKIVWRKASFSDPDGACVIVAETDEGIAVRNSNRPEEPTIVLARSQLAALIDGIKAGELDHLL
jgi:hypothetical protein